MPELPEAEITKRKLRTLILGKRILDLGGRKVLRVERKGKAILIYLSGGKILAFHQRMTGKLLVVDPPKANAFRRASKHIRRRFRLSSGKDLVLHDVRKFGVVWYGSAKEVFKDNYFKSLGPDALNISFANFKKLFLNKRGKIKPFLLNQKNLAGVGNIIADEILWHSKMHPQRNIQTLRYIEVERLWKSIKFVLNRSIKSGGTTMRDWLHPGGERGGYFKKRFVYDREDQKCFRCETKIFRIKVAGRSSYFCPKCQPRPRV